MTWFRASFEWARDLYAAWFADWLHVSFLIRTIILLLMLWLIIFVGAQVFKFFLGPLIVLIYVNVFKRIWNFLVTETLHEWIYINYYSKGDSKHSDRYMRLCDKVKRNRAILSDTSFKGIIVRGNVRKLGNYMMLSAALIVALWVGAFGLSQEYAMPAWVGGVTNIPEETSDYEEYADPDDTDSDNETENDDIAEPEEVYFPDMVTPSRFPSEGQVIFSLTDEASIEGARLRDGPGTGTVVIEMLFGYELLTYMGYYIPDEDVATLYWLRVTTPSGTEGYIASHLVMVAG